MSDAIRPLVHPLLGARLRLKRANVHLAALREVMQLWADEHSHLFEFHANEDGTNLRPVMAEGKEYPLKIIGEGSAIAGEVIYSLRTALDYLVYGLAISQNHWRDVKGTQFPIVDCEDDWIGAMTGKHPDGRRVRHQLKKVPTKAAARIRQLQPFEGCTWTGILRDLSNEDKHRGLLALSSQAQPVIGAPLEDQDGELAVWASFEVEIFLHDGEPLSETLEFLCSRVGGIIEQFEPGFKGFPEIGEV